MVRRWYGSSAWWRLTPCSCREDTDRRCHRPAAGSAAWGSRVLRGPEAYRIARDSMSELKTSPEGPEQRPGIGNRFAFCPWAETVTQGVGRAHRFRSATSVAAIRRPLSILIASVCVMCASWLVGTVPASGATPSSWSATETPPRARYIQSERCRPRGVPGRRILCSDRQLQRPGEPLRHHRDAVGGNLDHIDAPAYRPTVSPDSIPCSTPWRAQRSAPAWPLVPTLTRTAAEGRLIEDISG